MSTTTIATSHLHSNLPLSSPYKLTDHTARKTADTELTVLSLFSSAGAFNVPSSDPLPSGVSFLLEIHRRREQSASPSQKMKRKEREYVEKYTHPSLNATGMGLVIPTKSAAPRQSMTKEERTSLLNEALNLISED
jgi:hypothetical protein